MKMKQDFLKKNIYKTLLLNGTEQYEDNKHSVVCYFFKPYSKVKNGTFFNKKLSLQCKYIKETTLIKDIKLPLTKERFHTYLDFQKYLIESNKNSDVLGLLIFKNKIFLGQSVLNNFELSEDKLFFAHFSLLKTFASIFQFEMLTKKKGL